MSIKAFFTQSFRSRNLSNIKNKLFHLVRQSSRSANSLLILSCTCFWRTAFFVGDLNNLTILRTSFIAQLVLYLSVTIISRPWSCWSLSSSKLIPPLHFHPHIHRKTHPYLLSCCHHRHTELRLLIRIYIGYPKLQAGCHEQNTGVGWALLIFLLSR